MRLLARGTRLGTIVLAIAAIGCEHSVEPPPRGATALSVAAGGRQGANVGSPLAVSPVVKVVNRQGEPVEGVRVTFAIAAGGGSITGPSAITNAEGLASVGSWTLGSVGENRLNAQVSGLNPIAITAVGRCPTGSTIGLDATVSGTLSSEDCRFEGGQFTERFTFTTATQRAVQFTQSSAAMDSFLELQGTGSIVAFNDDMPGATTDHASLKVILAPGSYDANPSSFNAGETGAYTLLAEAVPESGSGCAIVFVVPGIETVQTLGDGDCVSGTFRYDAFAVYLHAGETYTIEMRSPTFDTYLELLLYGPNSRVASNDDINSTNTDSRIAYVPAASGFYLIAASSAQASGNGSYTLIIQ